MSEVGGVSKPAPALAMPYSMKLARIYFLALSARYYGPGLLASTTFSLTLAGGKCGADD
jgi:hypothetical protein